MGLVNDVLCIPGEVVLKGGRLHMVALRETHPYAAEMVVCLTKLLAHFGNPSLAGEIPGIPKYKRREFRPKVEYHFDAQNAILSRSPAPRVCVTVAVQATTE